MALATLSIDLEMRLAKLQADQDKAARMAEKNADQIRASYAKIGSAAAGLGSMIASAFAGYSVQEFIKSNATAIDSLNDVADATGASIETISGLEQVAMRTGGNLQQVESVLIKFNKALNEGNPNGPLTQTLKSIGLNAEELRRMDPGEALRQTAIALSDYADDGNKARLIQELFGKSVKEAAPFLKDLAEAGELNAKVTTAQAEEAEKFNKQLFELKTNSENSARAITSSLLPAINSLFDAYKQGGARGAIDQFGALFGLDEAYYEMRNKVKPLERELASLQSDQATYADAVAKNPSNREYIRLLAETSASIETVTAKLEKARATYLRITDGSAGAGRGVVNPPLVDARPSAPDAPAKPDSAALGEEKRYENLIKKIRERLDIAQEELKTGEKLKESDKLRFDVMAELGVVKLTDAHKAEIKALLDRAVAAGKLREAQVEGAKLADAESKAAAAYASNLDESNRSLRDQIEEIGKTTQEIEALRLARLQEAIARKEQQVAALEAMGLGEQEAQQLRVNIDLLKQQLALRGERAGASQDDEFQKQKEAALQKYEEVGLTMRQIERLRLVREADKVAIKEQELATLRLSGADAAQIQSKAVQIDQMRQLLTIRQETQQKIEAIANMPSLGAKQALQAYQEKVDMAGDATRDAFTQSLNTAEETLMDFFRTGELNAAKFADEVIAQIMRIAVVRPLVNAAATGIMAMFGFADGGAFDAGGQVKYFAKGDVFNGPTPFSYGGGNLGVLGEAGPEGVLPLKRGADGKLGVIANGGSRRGMQVTYAPQIYVDSRSDRAAIQSDMQQALAQNNREMLAMLKDKRY